MVLPLPTKFWRGAWLNESQQCRKRSRTPSKPSVCSFLRVPESLKRRRPVSRLGGIQRLSPRTDQGLRPFGPRLQFRSAPSDPVSRIEPARAISFSEFLVSQLARESYLPVLGVLDSPQPNDYHAALAGLARADILRAVVTTNFDTLIEAAFRQDGVPLATCITVDDYRDKSGGDTCGLFKIHGSAAAVSTLRDTVSQKIRGLPLYVRSRLAALYRQYHVLVVGFSGADLEFGDDYLAFSAIQSEGPGITWLVRPPDASPAGALVSRPIATLPPAAQAIVRGAAPGER